MAGILNGRLERPLGMFREGLIKMIHLIHRMEIVPQLMQSSIGERSKEGILESEKNIS